MKLEDQVVSLELAKKLKELKVKQESLWYHYRIGDKWGIKLTKPTIENEHSEFYSAFTVSELGEILPETNWQTYREKKGWIITDHQINLPTQKADTEADARAKMLIYLLENKLI
jgi:hypothetical protein|tara:strand:+ start:1719 stop:2060 length:342 start_codon:yes stop_codon:yes gene_type:complete